ncbi:MAG TPA: hypothetical protein PLN60_11410 [Bacillota bacterium]|nr:hypothetical protein [Bacillota bacterium]
MPKTMAKKLVFENHICPLMSMPDAGTDCVKEHCALWDGDCAIVVIAKCLRGPVAVKNTPVVAGL